MQTGKKGLPKRPDPALNKSTCDDLSQLKNDLASLERLHALQSTLIRQIRRQVEELGALKMRQEFLRTGGPSAS